MNGDVTASKELIGNEAWDLQENIRVTIKSILYLLLPGLPAC